MFEQINHYKIIKEGQKKGKLKEADDTSRLFLKVLTLLLIPEWKRGWHLIQF